MRVRFGDFVLDPDQRVLVHAGVEQALEPKVFECLALLVAQAGKLTTMAQLRAHLWPDVSVADGALRRVINETRKAVGDSGAAQTMIRTRKGVGYVFIAQVSADEARATLPPMAAGHVAPSWPFVGRERELERLRNWCATPHAGGLCLISGEAGAGKSSLLARLEASACAHPSHWLTAHCQAALGSPVYWPFRQIASQLMSAPELRARVLPIVQQSQHALSALPEFGGAAAVASHFELCEAFGALLATLSQTLPLRIVIEDLHWADAGSIALLDAVARAARGRSLCAFATYRPEAVGAGKPLSQFIGRTSGREGVQSLHLPPLGLEDIRALLRSLEMRGWAGGGPHVLQHMTGGNALFLSELVRHALELELPLDNALPPSIAHIVEQRLLNLPEPTQRLLSQAAVLGHEFNLEVLSVLAARPSVEALLAELEPARRAGVLTRDPAHADRWLFSHALLGDALVERLSLQERAAHHCAAVRAWQALHGAAAPSGVLAAHAFEAGVQVPSQERRALCEQAGREAFAQQAFDHAVLQLGRVIQLLEQDDRSPAAAELSLLFARARWHADNSERDIEHAFLQAADRARRADLPELFAQAAIGYALGGDDSSVHLRSVSLRPEALELLEEAWTLLVRATPGGCAALAGEVPYRLAAALCWMRCEAGSLEDFQRAARLALRLAPPAPDPFRRMWLLAMQGVVDMDRTEEMHRGAVAIMSGHELTPVQRIDGWALAMGSRLAQGDLAGYERAVREVSSLVELLPQPARIGRHGARLSAYMAIPQLARVTLAVMRGELSHAHEAFTSMTQKFGRLGLASTREQANHIFCMLLWLFGYEGRAAELSPLVDRHLETHPDSHWFTALVYTQVALERGELAQAREHFRVLRESGFRPHLRGKRLLAKPETLVRAADACSEAGDRKDAELLYELLAARASQCIQDGALICLGSCARPLAELAFQLGDHALAEQHFRAALAQNETLKHQPELVRTRLGWARLLLANGQSLPARSLIAAARSSARAMGMPRAVAYADRLAASAGGAEQGSFAPS